MTDETNNDDFEWCSECGAECDPDKSVCEACQEEIDNLNDEENSND